MESLFQSLEDPWCNAMAIGLLSLVVLYCYSTWTYNTFRSQRVPGPKPFPLFGNLKDLLGKDPSEWQLSYASRFGKLYGIYLGRDPVLVVAEPDIIREITVKQFHCFSNRRTTQSFLQKPLDRPLTALTGDHWKHVRAAITPVFTTGKLRQMVSTLDGCAAGLSSYLEKHEGENIDVKELSAAFSMDVIAGTAFGLDVRSLENPDNLFLRNAQEFFSFSNKRSIKLTLILVMAMISQKMAGLMAKLGINIFNQATLAYIASVLKPLLRKGQNSGDYNNFVQLCTDQLVDVESVPRDSIRISGDLVWTTAGLLADDITSNAIVFILAGHETTSSLLTVFFYAMAMNMQVQERLYQEIAQDFDENLPYEKLSGMKYLDWCINETLRMYCPAARIDRLCSDTVTVGGVRISPGWGVYFPVYAIHHDPEFWPEPEKFRPERFSPDESKHRHPCAFIPFGFGPRNCIGMRLALLESKTAIAKVLLKFSICPCKETQSPPLRWKKGHSLLVPQDAIVLNFTRRST